MQPDDASETELFIDLQAATHEHHANHLGGLQCLLADGAVRFIASKTRPDVFHALVTRNRGDTPGDF